MNTKQLHHYVPDMTALAQSINSIVSIADAQRASDGQYGRDPQPVEGKTIYDLE